MNRERSVGPGLAAVAALCCGTAAAAADAPGPSLAIDPITARNLLAPVERGEGVTSGYRLDPALGAASGQRARLSVEVGDSTLFAIMGRLKRQPGPAGPLEAGDAKALGLGRSDGGKVYGGGISRTFGGKVDVSATYQYSKLSAGQPGSEERMPDGALGRSHSLRGTVRIRFRH